MTKLTNWWKDRRWHAVAYVVFFLLFWFLGKGQFITKADAYFGVILLHGVFFAGVWFVKKIIGR